MKRFAALTIALLLTSINAGCMTNNYNCNVKDACRTPGEAPK